jgi:hypothetical protein
VLDPLDGSLLWRERGNLGPQQGERLQLVGGEVLELAGVSFELTCRVIDKTWASWSLLLSPHEGTSVNEGVSVSVTDDNFEAGVASRQQRVEVQPEGVFPRPFARPSWLYRRVVMILSQPFVGLLFQPSVDGLPAIPHVRGLHCRAPQS